MSLYGGEVLRSRMVKKKRKELPNLSRGVKPQPKGQTRLEPLRSPQERVMEEEERRRELSAQFQANNRPAKRWGGKK